MDFAGTYDQGPSLKEPGGAGGYDTPFSLGLTKKLSQKKIDRILFRFFGISFKLHQT